MQRACGAACSGGSRRPSDTPRSHAAPRVESRASPAAESRVQPATLLIGQDIIILLFLPPSCRDERINICDVADGSGTVHYLNNIRKYP